MRIDTPVSSNVVFLACNFSNKRVKHHFVGLKENWERTLPIRVYLSDKVRGAGARDLWADISDSIAKANLAIFDVTSFRPNVVLELGYALASKRLDQVVICRDTTPNGKRHIRKKWDLSDIAHLYRLDYANFSALDEELLDHLGNMDPVINFFRLEEHVRQRQLSTPFKGRYVAVALDMLKSLRDQGPIRRNEFTARLARRDVDAALIERLLKRFDLAKPSAGRSGSWELVSR